VDWLRAARPSAGDAYTSDHSRNTLGEVLARPRYEVIPTKGTDEWVDDLPEEGKVTITCSLARGIEGTVRLAQPPS
jgi:hypothetical protein